MLITLMLALTAIIGYLMGSVNGSIIVSRLLFGSDVRRQGSGNAGLTNFYRTYGISGIVGVIAIDVLKGVHRYAHRRAAAVSRRARRL